MRYKVYKSLDAKASLFGLTGSYIRYCVIAAAVSAVIGMVIVGKLTNSLIGFLVFAGLTAVSYLGILAFQGRYSEKEKQKLLASRNLPDFICVKPGKFSRYVRRKNNNKTL